MVRLVVYLLFFCLSSEFMFSSNLFSKSSGSIKIEPEKLIIDDFSMGAIKWKKDQDPVCNIYVSDEMINLSEKDYPNLSKQLRRELSQKVVAEISLRKSKKERTGANIYVKTKYPHPNAYAISFWARAKDKTMKVKGFIFEGKWPVWAMYSTKEIKIEPGKWKKYYFYLKDLIYLYPYGQEHALKPKKITRFGFQGQESTVGEFYIADIKWEVGDRPLEELIREVPIKEILPLSSQILRIKVQGAPKIEYIMDKGNFLIKGENYKDYTSVIDTGIKIYPTWADFVSVTKEMSIYLKFSKQFKLGKEYSLRILDLGDNLEKNLKFVYTDTNVTTFIKINQAGYEPDEDKVFFVGGWLGTMGAMNIVTKNFFVKDVVTGKVVYKGKLKLVVLKDKLSGEDVYSGNFTKFTKTGTYYIYVPYIGKSYNFEIKKGVYNNVYKTVMKGFYYQRCGIELKPPFAKKEFSHKICHFTPAVIHWSAAQSKLNTVGLRTGQTFDMSGGWHDAGDYNRYTQTATKTLDDLMTIYEFQPDKYKDNELNIPESGNGIPDYLDEIKYELEWLLKMRTKDGAVYHKVTTARFNHLMPDKDTDTLYICAPTTETTAKAAAVLAQAYRVFKKFDKKFAERCLKAAKKSYKLLKRFQDTIPKDGFKNPGAAEGQPSIKTGGYPTKKDDTPYRAWAAAELFASTMDKKYEKDFLKYSWYKRKDEYRNGNLYYKGALQGIKSGVGQCKATLAYIMAKTARSDLKKLFIKKFKENAERMINDSKNYAYYVFKWSDMPIAFGSGGVTSRYGYLFAVTYFLTKEKKYLKYAKKSLEYQMGLNPLSMSLITGIGKRYPMHPLSEQSINDTVKEPIPGLPIFGPSYRDYGYVGNKWIRDAFVPSEKSYPDLYQFVDCENLPYMAEYTIEEIGVTAALSSVFK